MKNSIKTTPVSGGMVSRDKPSGRFAAVSTDKGVSKASPKSEVLVREASERRSAALKRLADR